MKLKNFGYDKNFTYFEHSLDSSEIPTVFIHGVGLDHSMWLPQKKHFKNKPVIFYDLINHGQTKKKYKDLIFENFVIQLFNLLEYLNIKKINLVGFSIGALIAQHFTSKYNEKINKLIIIASVYKRSSNQIKKVNMRFKNVLKGKSISNESINRWFNKDFLKNNPKVYDYFFNMLEKKNNKYFLPAYKLFTESDKYKLDFSNFNMPTLIMTGENEIGSTPAMSEMLQKKIKKSKLFIIPNAKHMATFEEAKMVNQKISEFIF